jgi:hypothetical protein
MPEQRPPASSPPPPSRQAAARPPSGAADIAAEHRELRARLDRLVTTTDLPVLVEELGALRTLLAQHFANEEEADGLHTTVERAAPHLLPALDRLLAEHDALLASADAAHAAAVACWRGPAAEVLHLVARLAGQLVAHEEGEETVLTESVYQDLGAGH